MSQHFLNLRVSPEEFLGDLTDAVYRVALRRGFRGSFIQVQLDLWNALREVLAGTIEVGNIPEFISAAKEDGTGPDALESAFLPGEVSCPV